MNKFRELAHTTTSCVYLANHSHTNPPQGLLGTLLMSLVVWSFIGMLFGFSMGAFYSWCGVLVFSGYIVVDTQMIMDKLGYDDYIIATIELYLDIINLFLYILRSSPSFQAPTPSPRPFLKEPPPSSKNPPPIFEEPPPNPPHYRRFCATVVRTFATGCVHCFIIALLPQPAHGRMGASEPEARLELLCVVRAFAVDGVTR